MTTFEFLVAAWALLLAPGPTNTLLALAGASGGFRHAARLMPAELLAYLAVTAPLALAGGQILAAAPIVAQAIKLAAAAWVMVLAVRLWTVPASAGGVAVSARQVLATTLLNPKALVFGLVLLPSGGAAGVPVRLGLLALSIVAVAAIWATAGAALTARAGGRAGGGVPWLRRAAASWLGLLALGLAVPPLHG